VEHEEHRSSFHRDQPHTTAPPTYSFIHSGNNHVQWYFVRQRRWHAMMCCVSRGMASTTECKALPRPPAYPPHFATCTHTCTHTHTTTFSSLHRVQICKTALDTHPPFSLSRAIIHTWWAFDLSLASAASAIVPTPAPRANGVGSTGERQWAGLLIS
jgi:hypothetical protein